MIIELNKQINQYNSLIEQAIQKEEEKDKQIEEIAKSFAQVKQQLSLTEK